MLARMSGAIQGAAFSGSNILARNLNNKGKRKDACSSERFLIPALSTLGGNCADLIRKLRL